MIEIILFLTLLTSVLVITSTNPIHSLLYLVITFFNVSLILLILNCEFLAFLFLVVYIGAVIVLFLFIVMMLNVKIIELNAKIVKYVPIGALILLIFLVEIFYILKTSLNFNTVFEENSLLNNLYIIEYYKIYSTYFNITAISNLLFTKYIFMFIIAGFVLLVAMIGAIILTLNHSFSNKRQDIVSQINVSVHNSQRVMTLYEKLNI